MVIIPKKILFIKTLPYDFQLSRCEADLTGLSRSCVQYDLLSDVIFRIEKEDRAILVA
jgi:hypothetical protein